MWSENGLTVRIQGISARSDGLQKCFQVIFIVETTLRNILTEKNF